MSLENGSAKKAHSIDVYLRIETAGGAAWSPGTKTRHAGREIAFVYNGSGNFQIYKILSRYPGSWPQRLTYSEDRTTYPMYAPDGSLFYSQDQNGNEKWQIYYLKPGFGVEPISLTKDPEIIHNLTFIGENGYYFSSNKRDPKIFDIYYGSFNDIKKEQKYEMILENPGINLLEVLCCYDNNWLLIKEIASNFESSLHVFDLKNKKLIPITNEFSKGKNAIFDSGWFIDDTYLLVVSDFGRDFRSLGLINWRGPLEGIRWLEPDQFDTEHVDVHVNSKKVVYTKNKDGYSKLYYGYLNEQYHFLVKEIPVPEGGVIDGGDRRSFIKPIAWNPAGDRLAITMSTPQTPMNIWTYELRDTSFGYWKITQADGAGIPSHEYIKPELIKYNSLHKIKIPFFMYLPKGDAPNQGWPALVMIHGGPESQIRPGFNGIIQYLTASGFAVITPNVRGSTGYGRRYSSFRFSC
jgi:dipeptidyl aminopeptidase/acylaminoacyl peptidase